MTSRTDRGRESELVAARYFKEHLWPECQATPASLPGKDLRNTPGAAVEIKARSKFSPTAWLRQSSRNAGEDMPLVLMRPIGYGPKQVGDWLMFMRNKDFVDLWRKAYGGGGSKRAAKRSSRGKNPEDNSQRFGLRLESQPNLPSTAVLQGALSSLLHAVGFEPGDYEVEIRGSKGRGSSSGVQREP